MLYKFNPSVLLKDTVIFADSFSKSTTTTLPDAAIIPVATPASLTALVAPASAFGAISMYFMPPLAKC